MTVETECVDPEQMNRPAMIIDGKGVQKNGNGDVVVVWTYDVSWEPSDIHWASRWDIYLSMNDKYVWFQSSSHFLSCHLSRE